MAPSENQVVSVPRIRKGLLRKFLRPILLGGVVAAIIMQIVALSPSSVEESRDNSTPIDAETLIPKEKTILAPGIPTDRVPEYSVDQFNYISTHESVKEWNLIADHADMYNAEKLVHARVVKAFLYDPDGKATIVTGGEAKYLMAPTSPSPHHEKEKAGQRDLEVFGDVKTVFPDGFEVHSDYMRYKPDLRTVEIPVAYETTGKGIDQTGQLLSFASRGMTYAMGKSEIVLHDDVRVTVAKQSKVGPSEKTLIESDHCLIDRAKNLAYFTMDPARPISERFVRVIQPTLFSKGRRGDLNYGNIQTVSSAPSPQHAAASASSSGNKLVNHIVLYDDVLLKELGKHASLQYATAGQANFDGASDIVILTQYPQVYQGGDTVTGDRILLHRDTDIVEVDHSNSFSQGDSGPER